jgi:Domain of unknown function (DUF2935)
MKDALERNARFEHRFRLQFLGAHSRFIHDALSPIEKENIKRASEFIQIFEVLLGKTESADILQLTIKVENETLKLQEFKLNLLQKHLLIIW